MLNFLSLFDLHRNNGKLPQKILPIYPKENSYIYDQIQAKTF